MPHPISLTDGRRRVALWLLCLAFLGAVGTAPIAQGAEAQLNAKVPASKWKAVRLKNLPEGTKLSLRVIADGSLSVILVHETELKRYPKAISPAFQGTLDRSLTFSVVIPDSGNYYVILDNRRNAQERRVRILIQATAPQAADPPPADSGGEKKRI